MHSGDTFDMMFLVLGLNPFEFRACIRAELTVDSNDPKVS